MTEEAQPSVEPEVAPSEPTLDDVISEFNIEPVVEAQKPVETPTEPQYAPQTELDPYDAQSIQGFVDNRINPQQQALEQMQSQLAAIQQKETNAQVDADIKQAVGTIKDSVDGLTDEMAHFFLDKRVGEDANLKAIWDNRQAKPQALEKALKVIAGEARTAFSLKPDGQLVENQRAMSQSIQTNTNQAVAVNSLEERLNSAPTLAERDRIRREMMNG